MDCGQFLSISLHFDDNNYAYWKMFMRAILESIEEKVW